MIEIKRLDGTAVLSLAYMPSGALVHRELGGEHYVKVPFTTEEPVTFRLGDYVVLEDFGRFELTKPYVPEYDERTASYSYTLQLDAHYMKWKNKICRYIPSSSASETSFHLTAAIDIHLGVIVKGINALGAKDSNFLYEGQPFTFALKNFPADEVGVAKYKQYQNTDFISALDDLATIFDCEWWVEGNIINFGKCKLDGTEIELKQDKNVEKMTGAESSSDYATRVIAFGADRNLPSSYRKDNSADVTQNGVVQKRLMLPLTGEHACKFGYLQDAEVSDETDAVEIVFVNDDIYPRTQCTVSKVETYESTAEDKDTGETVTKTFYRLTDGSGFAFSNDYILDGETLHILFQSGKMNGMDFECTYNEEKKYYEVVVNEDYGRELPDTALHPEVGDKFVLYGWDSGKIGNTGLIEAAEEELYQSAVKKLQELKTDPNTYTCSMMSDWYEEKMSTEALKVWSLGQPVKLVNPAFFVNGRSSRIIGYEIKLDIPYDTPEYIVGEAATYSRTKDMESKIDSLTYNGVTYQGGSGGSGIYLITTTSQTPASDYNAYSAARSDKNYLRKDKSDVAKEPVRFEKGINIGDENSGKSIDKDGNANLSGINSSSIDNSGRVTTKDLTVTDAANVKNLTVSGKATFFELEIQKASAAGGLGIYSPGSARVDIVEEWYDTTGAVLLGWKCWMLARDADGNTVQQTLKAGDNVVSFTFNTGAGNWDGAANRWWWRRVTATTFTPTLKADGQRYFSFTLSKSLCAEGSDEPKVGDRLMVLGNKDDKSRQNAIVICAHEVLDAGLTAPYMAQYVGISDFDLSSHRESWWGYDADHRASNHFTGKFSISGSSGETPIVNDRGAWTAGASYDYYDRVSYGGSLYLMTNKAAGTTTGVPGLSTDWTLQVSAGTDGKDGTSISIKGSAVAHYASASEIDLTTAKSGYYLTDTGSSEQHKRGITIVSGGMIVNDIDVEDGDSYTTLEDGHLWTANAGKDAWDDCGKIEGAKGADAVVWRLIPYSETLAGEIVKGEASDGTAYRSYHIKGTLLYTAEKWEGGTRTRMTLGDDVYWRWKTAEGTAWGNVKTPVSATPDWIYDKAAGDPSAAAEDKSLYAVVELVVDGATADRRVVNAVTDAKAYMDVDAELGRVELGVKGLSESVVKLEEDSASMSTRMGKAEAKVETSVQYDPETGKVTSNVTLSADRIDLEGAVSANGEFRIDEWGNVMTGTQYGIGTTTYIAEDKSNLIFTSDARVSLPNDAEFIGRRMLIMAQPPHNSAGVVLKDDGAAVTDVSQYPKVEIVTGNVFVKGVYGVSVLDGAESPDTVVEQSDADGSPYWGVRWFGGSHAFHSETGGAHWQQPSLLTLRGGYVELLGVEYSVSRVFRSKTPELGGTLWSVHMARAADDGTVTTADPYSGEMTISDTDADNGSVEALESGTATPWEKAERLCLWTVVGVSAQEFTAGLRN